MKSWNFALLRRCSWRPLLPTLRCRPNTAMPKPASAAPKRVP